MIYENNFQNREELTEINVSVCRYQTKQARGFPLHCHSFFELEYSVKGRRLATLGGRRFLLPEGSLYFVPILGVHSTTNIEPYTENIIIQFTREFLYENARSLSPKAVITPDGELSEKGYIVPVKNGRLAMCLERIAAVCPLHCVDDWDVKERVNEEAHPSADRSKVHRVKFPFPFTYTPCIEWKINGLTMELVALLFDEKQLKIEANMGNPLDTVRIQPVLDRLITHPENQMSLREASEFVSMSYSNFSRTFKQLIGYNYVDYCNIARIHRAEELLRYSDFSVTQIAAQLNFGCINYFNRIFKKYNGSSPLYYRKKTRF